MPSIKKDKVGITIRLDRHVYNYVVEQQHITERSLNYELGQLVSEAIETRERTEGEKE